MEFLSSLVYMKLATIRGMLIHHQDCLEMRDRKSFIEAMDSFDYSISLYRESILKSYSMDHPLYKLFDDIKKYQVHSRMLINSFNNSSYFQECTSFQKQLIFEIDSL
ncbi:MAG: hypothetical protein RBS55_01685 [Bacteroidales bacterium]|jgi:hypothetical protein|nr:hypothetical protein [Bacteroidales bacterium]